MLIKRYSLQEIISNPDRFNVNNLYEEGDQPKDYWSSRYYTEDWIELFHDQYFKMTLTADELKWMKKAVDVSQIRFKFPAIFEDELEKACDNHRLEFEDILNNGDKWFIRTENYSFKNTVKGVGPYNNLKDIFKSLTTYIKGHSGIDQDDATKTLYFLPWIEMDYQKEFRIFIYQNTITAISDQHLYCVNKWLASKTDTEISALVRKIITFFNDNIKERLAFIENYVMDLALIGEEETPYFIEPNAFGAKYGAGSALFHWINDHDQLHGKGTLEFRFVSKL